MTHCIAFGLLEGYSRGEAPPEQQRFVEAHCASCDECRWTLEAVALAAPPETGAGLAAEAALVGSVSALRPVDELVSRLLGEARSDVRRIDDRRREPAPARRRWSIRWMTGGASVAAAVACAALLLTDRTGVRPDLDLPYRAAQGRPALAQMPHAPFVPLRGEDRDPPEYDRALGWLLSRPASRKAETAPYLAALYLWRGEKGDRRRAEMALRATPEGARRDNDIGVLLLASGEGEAALMAFDAALEKDAGLAEAMFNRGFALEVLGRKAEAADAWAAYLREAGAGDDERAWAAEARQHLETLRRAE